MPDAAKKFPKCCVWRVTNARCHFISRLIHAFGKKIILLV
jgi:hypothetical protein